MGPCNRSIGTRAWFAVRRRRCAAFRRSGPAGKFLYVTNAFSSDVSAFQIDPGGGSLAEITGSPYPTGNTPIAVAADPSGKFLFVTNGYSTGDCILSNQPERSLRTLPGQLDASRRLPRFRPWSEGWDIWEPTADSL